MQQLLRLGILQYINNSSVDLDATAFLTATEITDPTISSAVNTLVLDLKAEGIWTKMLAIYPFVGGTASTHKWNLKNPEDTNAAFRLTFFGGWTHSPTGAKPNGTNAYATTNLVPSAQFATADASAHYYSRTTTAELTTTNANGVAIGCRSGGANDTFQLTIKRNTDNNTNFLFSATGTTSNNFARFTDSNGDGFYSGNVLSSTSSIYRNGVDSTTSFLSFSRNTPNVQLFIGAINNKDVSITDPTLKESAFAAIGTGLTSGETLDFYTAVQAFQTTLGRNV